MRAACLFRSGPIPAWILRAFLESRKIAGLELIPVLTAGEYTRPKDSLAERLDKRWFGTGDDPTDLLPLPADITYKRAEDVKWDGYELLINFTLEETPASTEHFPSGLLEYRFVEEINFMRTMVCVCRGGKTESIVEQKTYRGELSSTQNRAQVYWKASYLLSSALLGVIEQREISPLAPVCLSKARYSPTPGAFRTSKGLLEILKKKMALRSREGIWSIRLYEGKIPLSQIGSSDNIEMPQPDGLFRADPFFFSHMGEDWLFYEELRLDNWKGYLCAAKIENGGFADPVKVLEEPWHLSYPFVFSHDGEIYLIPESSSTKTIELYRCERFPDEWIKVRSLLEGMHFADTTLVRHDGMWWMFTCAAHSKDYFNRDELYLYYADDPIEGTWHPHPMNPVVCDNSLARPAGRVEEENGVLWRSSQDNSLRYGRGLNWNCILQMDKECYREELAEHLVFDESTGIMGAHTFNQSERWTVIDLQRNVPKNGSIT